MAHPNTLRLQFTPNYTGNHRVCYRLGIAGPFDCSTVVAGVVGVPQTVDIPFDYTVIDLTCNSDVITGYVQPVCVPESCPYLRTDFLVSYTPYCRLWTVECTDAPVETVGATSVGSGYTPGAVIPVIFTGGGGGVGAAADAYIADAAVGSIGINNPGTGYTDGTFYNVATVPAGPQPAVGTGLVLAQVEILGGTVNSFSFAQNSADAGAGYVNGDTFTLNIPGNPGNGDIELVAGDVHSGDVLWIDLTNPGSGYTVAPGVSIGGTAVLVATLMQCPAYDLGTDCSGFNVGLQLQRSIGWKYFICQAIGPGNPSTIDGWTATLGTLPANCCYACEQLAYTNSSGGALNVFYIDYATRAWTLVNVPDGDTLTVQIVQGSAWLEDGTPSGSPLTGTPC